MCKAESKRSQFIVHHGVVEFLNHAPYSRALTKIQRGHPRDIGDVDAMFNHGLIDKSRLADYFLLIESGLIRYPAIAPSTFKRSIADFCKL